jgi:hypothetical protein
MTRSPNSLQKHNIVCYGHGGQRMNERRISDVETISDIYALIQISWAGVTAGWWVKYSISCINKLSPNNCTIRINCRSALPYICFGHYVTIIRGIYIYIYIFVCTSLHAVHFVFYWCCYTLRADVALHFYMVWRWCLLWSSCVKLLHCHNS